MAKKRTEVADIDRSLYDFKDSEEGFERLDAGLTPEIVTEISQRKDEPAWMLDSPPEVARDLQLHAEPHVGAVDRRPGHGPHRHLREAQHRPEGRLGLRAR